MDDVRVDPAMLQGIAEHLDRAAAAAVTLPVPARTPSAGPCTGAVAAAMGAYLDAYSALADGLGGSAAGVRQSHASYLETDRQIAESLRGFAD